MVIQMLVDVSIVMPIVLICFLINRQTHVFTSFFVKNKIIKNISTALIAFESL